MTDYVNIKEEEVFTRMKGLEPFRLFSHHDADGVYGAVLLSKVFEIGTIEFPDIFGEYGEDANVSIDFGQPLTDMEWSGIAIDHHPHDMRERKYALIRDNMPAGGIVYDAFKTKIPPEYSWLVAGAYVGDGQAAMIPPDIYEQHPSLLEGRASIYQSYGKTSVYEYSLYSLLSSPINAVCRIGRAYQAYQILKTCKTPDDVISNQVYNEA